MCNMCIYIYATCVLLQTLGEGKAIDKTHFKISFSLRRPLANWLKKKFQSNTQENLKVPSRWKHLCPIRWQFSTSYLVDHTAKSHQETGKGTITVQLCYLCIWTFYLQNVNSHLVRNSMIFCKMLTCSLLFKWAIQQMSPKCSLPFDVSKTTILYNVQL